MRHEFGSTTLSPDNYKNKKEGLRLLYRYIRAAPAGQPPGSRSESSPPQPNCTLHIDPQPIPNPHRPIPTTN